jgi:aspartyl/asparaginyl-tRNA synthetase
MQNSHIVFLINDEVRAIEGEYEEGGKRHIFKTFDPTIRKDDLVVVQSGTRHAMTVFKVTDVDVEINFDTHGEITWIVQRIDKDAFDHVLDQESEAISAVQSAERRRKKKELRDALFKDHEEMVDQLAIAHQTDGEDVTE